MSPPPDIARRLVIQVPVRSVNSQMKPRRIPTIRSRLMLLVLACITPAFLMVGGLISYNYYESQAETAQTALETARAMVSAVDQELGGVQAALQALGTSPYLTSNDLAGFYDQATEALKTLKARNIVLIDQTFRQSLNTARPYGSELPSRAEQWAPRVFDTGKPITTDVFLGPVVKRFTIAIAVPVYRGDKVTYVLAAGVWPETLSDLLTTQHLAAGWIGAIFDTSGTVVARTHQSDKFVGTKGTSALIERVAQVNEGSVETKSLEGIPVLSVFSRSANSNWTVALGIPTRELTAGLVNTLRWLVGGTALLLFTSLMVAWAIGANIAIAIDRLVEPALALGYGESVVVPPLPLKEANEVGKALTKASEMLIAAHMRANHDVLTGLGNRALFNEVLAQQLEICSRTNTNIGILYLDLDGFKKVNDMYGHTVGDEVLCMAAARLKSGVRAADLVVRMGGDEFAVMLVNSGLEGAQALSEKLIDSLSALYSIGSVNAEISASIGIAIYPTSATTSEALLRRADESLYKAKAAGKRRYAVAG